MNFFQLQEQARVKTRRLIFVYILAVLVIVVALDAVFLAVKYFTANEGTELLLQDTSIQSLIASDTNSLLLFSLGIIAFIGLASLYRMMSLRGGGSKVATALGGTRVDGNHADRKVRRLVNIVEEMAIASGLPVPQVYVLEQESGINAFAAGNQPEDAAVAVTRGALETFNRDELQGVLGHEFSHILNGDMRMNIRLLGPLFGIMLIGTMGGLLLRTTAFRRVRSSRESSGGVMVMLLLGLSLIVIGYIGLLAGRMIKAAISRQREYLADASAVQFTRDNEGIGGALKKIAAWAHGSTLTDAGAEEVSHMLFANGLRQQFSGMLATHPPIMDRIQRIGMQFSNQDLARLAAEMQNMDDNQPASASSSADGTQAAFTADSVSGFAAAATAQGFDDESLRSARTVINEVPEKIRQQVESINTVREVVLALLLSDDDDVKGQQIQVIQTAGSDNDWQRVITLRQQLDGLSEGLRLPILDLAFPAVRQLTWQQRMDLYVLIEKLIPLDGVVSSFEYMLSRLLLQMLEENRRPDNRSGTKKLKLVQLKFHLRTLFSVLAIFGHDTEDEAIRSYNAGMGNLLGQQWPEYYMPADWVTHFDSALQAIDRVRPLIKEEIIKSLVVTIGFDHEYRVEEYEMLRVISALMHSPMPLFSESGRIAAQKFEQMKNT